MFRIACGILRDHAQAEDIVQDIFTYVSDQYEVKFVSIEEEKIPAYLRKSAYYNAIKKSAYRDEREQPLPPEIESRESLCSGVEEVIIAKEGEQRVFQTIREMNATYRDVLQYKYIDGLKPKEIAQRMGLEQGTVYQRLYRGRKYLAARLLEIRLQEERL